MPFITQDNRKKVLAYKQRKDNSIPKDWQVGDWCYYFYVDMVKIWKEKRRWSTAHTIYKEMLIETSIMLSGLPFAKTTELSKDIITAYNLAWQVFFIKHVMIYENEKEQQNGEI